MRIQDHDSGILPHQRPWPPPAHPRHPGHSRPNRLHHHTQPNRLHPQRLDALRHARQRARFNAVRHQVPLTHDQSPSTPEEHTEYKKSANGFSYLEGIGAVLYVTQTRPDIQHAISILAQFGANPGKAHLEAFKRLLRYLNGTAHFGLTLSGKNDSVDLIGWTDADWAQDPETRRSVSGYVFDVAGGSVSWASKKQPTVALSTVESEYMAASNATKEAIWLRVLLEDLGYPQVEATTINEDNLSCIALSHGTVHHSRAKNISTYAIISSVNASPIPRSIWSTVPQKT